MQFLCYILGQLTFPSTMNIKVQLYWSCRKADARSRVRSLAFLVLSGQSLLSWCQRGYVAAAMGIAGSSIFPFMIVSSRWLSYGWVVTHAFRLKLELRNFNRVHEFKRFRRHFRLRLPRQTWIRENMSHDWDSTLRLIGLIIIVQTASLASRNVVLTSRTYTLTFTEAGYTLKEIDLFLRLYTGHNHHRITTWPSSTTISRVPWPE